MKLNYKGIPVHYTSFGAGKTIVVLHGFLEDSTMWNTLLPALTKNHRVICIDLLGHGKTGCLGYVHTMEDQAKMVHAVLKQENLRRYTFIGHSMGGYVALAYAQLAPQNVKGLLLLNSTFTADSAARKKIRKRGSKMATTNYHNLVRMSFLNLFSETSKIRYKKEIEAALKVALKTSVQGFIAANEGMLLRENTETVFVKGAFKKALFLGKKDQLIDAKSMKKFAKQHQIPITFFSEGHMSTIENKDELVIALVQFLKSATL